MQRSPSRSFLTTALSGLALLGAACGGGSSNQPGATGGPSGATGSTGTTAQPPALPIVQKSLADVGLDAAALDRTADPCEDFYQFACGGWMAKTEIAADKPLAMRSFVDIDDRNQEFLHAALEKARTEPGDDPMLKNLGAFYGACLDEDAIAKSGRGALRDVELKIRGVHDAASLAGAVAAMHGVGASALFGFGPTQDAKDATQVIASLGDGGLGLPDRDYYLNTDEQSVALRKAYRDYVASVLVLSGQAKPLAGKNADTVLMVETELAKIALDKVARRDPVKTYNRIDGQLPKLIGHFDWNAYWKGRGIVPPTQITVDATAYLTGLDGLLQKIPSTQWQTYLLYHLLADESGLLGKAYEDAAFAFSSIITGTQEQEPRWKKCVGATDALLGDWLSQVYIREMFPGDSKSAALAQIHTIVDAMGANLTALGWMDDTTRARAQAKLAAMSYQIGFPNKWKAYDFTIDGKAYTKTALAAIRFEDMRELGKIGKPLDRDEWHMTASQVNAYYDPQINGMVFPAGILQRPFFDFKASADVNLGGMGMVVGHELTHGFDDQGSQFDEKGNLSVWWQEATAAQFKQRTQCVVDQYKAYEIAPGVNVNGELTLGENIADIGGLKLALTGARALRRDAKESVLADGFTQDQQFFLGFGQAWCAKMRPDYAKMLANVDVHSPARWRVNGTLQASPEFAKVWSCKDGQAMKPAKVCEVW